MEQYIKKSALVAEIERRISDNKKDIERASHKNLEDYFEGYEDALVLLKEKFIDTFEVKEVNEVPATVMVNKYGNRFISSWSGLKEYDGLKEGEEIKILIPKK